jgi:hypothetical protein
MEPAGDSIFIFGVLWSRSVSFRRFKDCGPSSSLFVDDDDIMTQSVSVSSGFFFSSFNFVFPEQNDEVVLWTITSVVDAVAVLVDSGSIL